MEKMLVHNFTIKHVIHAHFIHRCGGWHTFHFAIHFHGNAEKMRSEDGEPHTAHTTNLVPVLITKKDIKELIEQQFIKRRGDCYIANPLLLYCVDDDYFLDEQVANKFIAGQIAVFEEAGKLVLNSKKSVKNRPSLELVEAVVA